MELITTMNQKGLPCAKVLRWILIAGFLTAMTGCVNPHARSVRIPDTDKDTVADTSDRCPGTQAGDMVNRDGCATAHGDGVFSTLFASGSTELTAENKFFLNVVASILKRSGGKTDAIKGYSDLCEGEAVSRRLAQMRIERVVSYLLSQGVRPDQLGTRVNYGNAQPFEQSGNARPDCENIYNNAVYITIIPRGPAR